jgi:hypothetical protein
VSSSWEAASCVATQKFSKILWISEGSLPYSQEPSSGAYTEPDQSSP